MQIAQLGLQAGLRYGEPMDDGLTGGCQCGRVRYVARIDGRAASACHCRMCQRATGGIHASFQAVALDALTWTTRPPDYHASSPIARRGFCGACGTPISFEFVDDPHEIELTVGSFDEPWRLSPDRQFGLESRLEAWRGLDALPGILSADNPNVAQRWRNAGAAIPE